jgi:hypothetical protein
MSSPPTPDPDAIAAEILAASAERRQIAPFTARLSGISTWIWPVR